MEVVKAGVEAIPAQEITVSQMGADYLSEYVYIKDVTLGTYNASGSTPVTDATGSTVTKTMYFGTPSYTVYSWANGRQYIKGACVDGIEQ